MKNYKVNVGEYVFVKFNRKWRLSRIETAFRKGNERWYDVSVWGAKRFQRRREDELMLVLPLDEYGNVFIPKCV